MRQPRRLSIYYVFTFIFLIKLALFAADHKVCFLMGDSGSYLASALTRWAPWDRSYTYGLWIRFLTKQINSLYFVILCQTLLSAASSSLVSLILNRILSINLWIAAACGFLCAIEPLQLMSERMILTEATSSFLFALLVTLAVAYSRRPRVWLLIAIPLVSVYLVSLRVSFLPAVLSTLILPALPLIKAVKNRVFRKREFLHVAVHLAILCLCLAFAFRKYETWYGKKALIPPSLNGSDGLFLVAVVAPILQASDFQDPAFGARVLAATKLDLRAPMLRQGQSFSPNGLVSTLMTLASPVFTMEGIIRSNEIARYAAKHAVLNHPVEFAALVRYDILDYFNLSHLQEAAGWDEFRGQPLNTGYQGMIAKYGLHVTAQPAPGLVMEWHYHAVLWYLFLILFPAIPTGYLLIPGLGYKREMLMLTIYAWGQWAITTMLVQHDTPRYETGLAWLFFPIAGIVASEIHAIVRKRRALAHRRIPASNSANVNTSVAAAIDTYCLPSTAKVMGDAVNI